MRNDALIVYSGTDGFTDLNGKPPHSHSSMKAIAGSIVLICCMIFSSADADASWLLDRQRFHTSVHGQLSCQDCHEETLTKQPHPDPADVNKGLKDFFRLEQCTNCHEDVWEEIVSGTHGDENITGRNDYRFCIGCHDPHYQASYSDAAGGQDRRQDSPELSEEERQCMRCHEYVSPKAPRAAEKISQLCFHCHGDDAATDGAAKTISPVRIDVGQYATTAHSNVACTVCHPQSAEFKHGDQAVADCRQCHPPHDAKVAHDVHLTVACGACHLKGASPVKNPASDLILWHKDRPLNSTSDIHQMVTSSDRATCRGCHFNGNPFGVAAMVLPAKSLICMPCHSATLSVGDTTTAAALIFFLFGFLGLGSVWISGSLRGEKQGGPISKIFRIAGSVLRAVFSIRIFAVFETLFWDGLLQRRLFRISRTRWLIHAMIFFPFVLRFGWGIVALAGSLWFPEFPGVWVMLDKNHPLTALLFDVTGLLVIAGVTGMIVRKKFGDPADKLNAMPSPDWPAYILLGAILGVGFLLEGMRITMSGSPASAAYAFVGYAISRLLAGMELTGIYGYIWYVHAILTGAFVAYLPFSRMIHIIMAPLVMAINAGSGPHRGNLTFDHPVDRPK